MSFYAWERGTILLPTAVVMDVKRTVRDAANNTFDDILKECKAWWTRNKTTSWDEYHQELHDNPVLSTQARWVLEAIYFRREGKPRQARIKDVEKYMSRYTNRDNSVSFEDATITFDGRSATWSVGENNHAPETARAHPVGKAFFARLNRIDWTRGSGGVIVGNDEYNRENAHPGGGGNYIVDWYGPRGRAEYKRVTGFDPGEPLRATRRIRTGRW